MMQSCASAAKLQGGGPILHSGLEAMGYHRVTTTSDRHRQPLAWAAKAVIRPLSCIRSWHRAQDDALRHLAGRNKTPEGDEKLTRQRHDHRLARAAASIGRSGMEPLGQGEDGPPEYSPRLGISELRSPYLSAEVVLRPCSVEAQESLSPRAMQARKTGVLCRRAGGCSTIRAAMHPGAGHRKSRRIPR